MNDNSYSSGIEIASGMTVYDQTGDKVGTVHDYDSQSNFLDVRKGWLFPKDIYVPLSLVDRVTPDGIYLRTTSDDLQNGNYDQPVYDQSTTTQYADSATYNTGSATTAAYNNTTGFAGTASGATGQTVDQTGQDIRVPVYEEELVVGKRREEEGRVHIHKDVVEEPRTETVETQHERVTVERVPLSGSTTTDDAFTDRDIDVPLYGEEVVVGKQVRGVEEVRVRKDVVTEDEQVTDTVRKERVEVDGLDGEDVTATDLTNSTSTRR